MNHFSSHKLLRHLDRVFEWRRDGLSRPITYELDMTNRCNSRCPFCFGFSSDDPSSLGRADAENIISQIKAFGGKGITFTGGGEPLCNPGTVNAVRFAREIGLDVGFITNGILLDRANAETLVDACTWIRVSLDAGSKETYLRTHGLDGDTFERVTKNIALLAEVKRERKSAVTIGTGFITFPEATGDMVRFVEISRDAGADYAQFRPLLRKFRQTELNDRVDAAVLAQLESCVALATPRFQVLCSLHKYSLMKSGKVERSYGQCLGHHFAAVVAANKKMYLCCHMRGLERYCIGDLGVQPLEEIWRSPARRTAYENIRFADCPLLCRCDGFNTILWEMSQRGAHDSFL